MFRDFENEREEPSNGERERWGTEKECEEPSNGEKEREVASNSGRERAAQSDGQK